MMMSCVNRRHNLKSAHNPVDSLSCAVGRGREEKKEEKVLDLGRMTKSEHSPHTLTLLQDELLLLNNLVSFGPWS
jgi:hypothetical protein